MIGVVAHSRKADARSVVRDVCAELDRRGADYVLEDATAALIDAGTGLALRQLAQQCDVLVVMGGDGTILRVVHHLGANLLPIVGINLGSLGFLTCFGPGEVSRAVDVVLTGEYRLSQRGLLKVELVRGGDSIETFHALNDVTISRGEMSKLVKIEVRIDDELLTTFNADGLVICTPTGSTAYSLSAGGPILSPDSGVFAITPVCPHVLTNRATVVSDHSIVTATPTMEGQDVFINVDGQASLQMNTDHVLRISRSERVLPLAMLPERPFSEVLRQKLKWSGSNI